MPESAQIVKLSSNIKPGDHILIVGPRSSGKSVILENVVNSLQEKRSNCATAPSQKLIVHSTSTEIVEKIRTRHCVMYANVGEYMNATEEYWNSVNPATRRVSVSPNADRPTSTNADDISHVVAIFEGAVLKSEMFKNNSGVVSFFKRADDDNGPVVSTIWEFQTMPNQDIVKYFDHVILCGGGNQPVLSFSEYVPDTHKSKKWVSLTSFGGLFEKTLFDKDIFSNYTALVISDDTQQIRLTDRPLRCCTYRAAITSIKSPVLAGC